MSTLKKQDNLSPFTEEQIPDAMMRDAFIALSLSVLRDGWISSDTKYFIFDGMMKNLEGAGYSVEQREQFRTAMNIAAQRFSVTNNFMG